MFTDKNSFNDNNDDPIYDIISIEYGADIISE